MNLRAYTPRPLIRVAPLLICAIVLCLLTWPVWRWLWQEWMGNLYYSHGVLIPPVAVFLAVQRVRNDPKLVYRQNQSSFSANIALVVFALTVILYLATLFIKAYFLAAIMMIGVIGALVWIFGGLPALRKLLFPLGYLLLMVPLPFIERSTLPLALFSGFCSSGLVQLLGVDIQVVGNAVTLPNAELVIGAQCSGINSLIALTALTAIAAYILDGPLWSKALIVLLAIPLSLLSNILRISTLLLVARQFGAEAGFTYYHDYSGAIFFLLAMILLYPLVKLLGFRGLRLDVI